MVVVMPNSAYEVEDEDSLPTPTTIHYSPAWPRGDDKPLIGRVTHRVLSQTRVGGCPGTAARRPSPAAKRTSTTARPSPAARRRVQQQGDESSSKETSPAARRRVQQQGDESSSKDRSCSKLASSISSLKEGEAPLPNQALGATAAALHVLLL